MTITAVKDADSNDVSVYVGGRDDDHFLIKHLRETFRNPKFSFPGDYWHEVPQDRVFYDLLNGTQPVLESHGYVPDRQRSEPHFFDKKGQWTFVKRDVESARYPA